jgi:hypothetical protein
MKRTSILAAAITVSLLSLYSSAQADRIYFSIGTDPPAYYYNPYPYYGYGPYTGYNYNYSSPYYSSPGFYLGYTLGGGGGHKHHHKHWNKHR